MIEDDTISTQLMTAVDAESDDIAAQLTFTDSLFKVHLPLLA